MKKIFITFLLIVGVTLNFYGQGQTLHKGVSQEEFSALIDFYNSTNGKGWTTKWDTNKNVDQWHGVTVVSNNVKEIVFSTENNLSGTIPATIKKLTNLTYIYINSNKNLGGTIPTEITDMTQLTYLDLYGNNFSGTIPPELQQLTNLETLYLSGNQLTGEIPEEIYNMTNLKILDLGDNQLTGTIPPGLQHLTNLEELYFKGNQLTGEVPEEIYNLNNLTCLSVAGNRLTGTISPKIGNMPKLKKFYFGENFIGGALPDVVGDKLDLTHINLVDGQFDHLPDLSKLTQLDWVRMDGNRFDFADLTRAQIKAPMGRPDGDHYKYDRQAEITLEVQIDGTKTTLISKDDSVQDNVYEWYKDNTPISNSNVQKYVIADNTQSDVQGVYYCKIKNSNFPKLTLSTKIGVVGENNDYSHGVLKTDYEALVAIYNAANGENWIRKNNWLSDKNVSDWYGIKVREGRVYNIDLGSNQLQGTIAKEIKNLTELTFLNLSYNQLSGGLLAPDGGFKKLNWLVIRSNKIDHLPNLNSVKFIVYHIENNLLDFDDMVNADAIKGPEFFYYPQGNVGVELERSGNQITLSSKDTTAQNNTYQWYKNGAVVTGATNKAYVITDAEQVAAKGSYHCIIKNSKFTKLTLQTETAVIQGPKFEITPSGRYFGNVKVSDSLSQNFTIKNSGSEDLVINSFELKGNDVADFNIVSSETEKTIPMNETFTFEVKFIPKSVGTKNASLQITGNTGKHSINLAGEGKEFPVAGLSLNISDTSLKVSQTLDLVATVSPEKATNKNVSWESNANEVATVDASGKVTALKSGSATIKATTESGNFTALCNLTVIQPVTGVALNEKSKTVNVGETFSLVATIQPENADNKEVTWESKYDTIATVDADGKVSAVKGGETKIYVTTKDGNFKDSCSLIVLQPVTELNLNISDTTLKVNQTIELVATIIPEDATNKNVSWESENEEIATVSNNGKVTALKAGSTTIKATSEDGNFVKTCQLKVLQPVTGISLNVKDTTLKKEASFKLLATIQPENADNKEVTWESKYDTIATVDADGKVLAVKGGETKIYVTTKDGNFKDSCSLIVLQPVTELNLNISDTTLKVNETIELVATIIPEDATNKNVSWESENEEIATVSNNGKVTALKAGSTTIKATSEDGNFVKTCQLKVLQPVTGISLNVKDTTLKKEASFKLLATVQPENAGNKEVTWESSIPEIISVDEYGTVTALKVGQAKIYVTTKDGNFKDSCNIHVVTGINEMKVSSIDVYPNPAPQGNIKVKANEDYALKVTNISGKVILQREIKKSVVEEIVIYESGIYIFVFSNKDKVMEVKRVIIP